MIQKINTPDRIINQIQDNIKLAVDPVLALQPNSGHLIQSVVLVAGANSINHGLSRNLIGWFLTRLRASATIYDTQDSNSMPASTLSLVSSAPVTVDIFVF